MVVRARFVVLVALTLAGCRPAAPTGGAGPDEPDAPTGAAVADPELRQARQRADVTLDWLLGGKLDKDPDLSPVTQKVKGYNSYAIKAQRVVREGTAEFRGVLSGPSGRARFALTLVRQSDGRWAVGAFSGPDPE